MIKSGCAIVTFGEFLIEIEHKSSEISFTLMNENQPNVNRLLTVQITNESIFRHFRTLQDIIRYFKTQENVVLDLAQNAIVFKWKVIAKNYYSELQTLCKLKQIKFTQRQALTNENKILKLILERERQRQRLLQNRNNQRQIMSQNSQIEGSNQNNEKNAHKTHKAGCQIENSKIKIEQNHGRSSPRKKGKQCSKKKPIKKQAHKKVKHSQPKKSKIEKNYPSRNAIAKSEWKIKKQQQKYAKQYSCKKFTFGNKLRIEFNNGDYYYGEVDCHDLYNGQGFYFYQGNGIYEGQFKNGKKHGYGIRTYEDGSRYEGEFFDDDRSGIGKELFINGDRYEGEFKFDKRHGFGKYFFKGGQKYQGQFKRDLFHGEGKLIEKDGSYFVGKWYNDRFHGEGIMNFHDRTLKQVWKYGKLISEQKLKIDQSEDLAN